MSRVHGTDRMRNCQYCGQLFRSVFVSGCKSNRTVFCSKDCFNAATKIKKEKHRQEKYPERPCKRCGVMFDPGYHKYQMYCTNECIRLAKKDFNKSEFHGNCLACSASVSSYRGMMFCNRDCRVRYVESLPESERIKVCRKCNKQKFLYDYSCKKSNDMVYWNARCNKCRVDDAKLRYKTDKTLARNSNLRNLYNISIKEFDEIVAKQGGRCAICRREEDKSARMSSFHVDHDHKTGKVRGVLCGSCNISLGRFHDDVSILLNAVEYLKSHEE